MALKARVLTKFPARVIAETGLAVERENGEYTFSLDLGSLNVADTIPDDAAAYLVVLTPGETADDPDVVETISVETFLNETSAVNQSRVIASGAGLTGGGDLSADRTLAVGAGTGITVNADDVALDTAHVRNVDHSSVTITAGAGLTGGGTIESTRTLDVGAGTGITVNANDVALAAIADDRIMANVSGGSAAPSAQTLSAVLDGILGTTQGAIITRDGSGWIKLDPGTSGHFLKSNGAGANIAYAAIPGGGDLLAANNLSDVASVATARSNLLLGKGFSAHKNGSNQAGIADATLTKITFPNEAYDVGSYYDTTNSRWTPPAGLVLLNAAIVPTSNLSNTYCYLALYKNGSILRLTQAQKGDGTDVGMWGTWMDQANGTDYYELYAIADGTGAGWTASGDATATWFQGVFLG